MPTSKHELQAPDQSQGVLESEMSFLPPVASEQLVLLSVGPVACLWFPAMSLCMPLQEQQDLHPVLVFHWDLSPHLKGGGARIKDFAFMDKSLKFLVL